MQLGQYLNDFFLTGRVCRMSVNKLFPDFFNGSGSPQTQDEFAGLLSRTEVALGIGVLQHMPFLATESLRLDFHAGEQRNPQA